METLTSAANFFRAKLAFETDPADLAAARAQGAAPLVLDVRSVQSWAQGRIPGSVHAPLEELATRIAQLAPDPHEEIVVYCWGPGCNGSTRAALLLSELGYGSVRELIGGFEYWAREGLAVLTDNGRTRHGADPLVAPVSS